MKLLIEICQNFIFFLGLKHGHNILVPFLFHQTTVEPL